MGVLGAVVHGLLQRLDLALVELDDLQLVDAGAGSDQQLVDDAAAAAAGRRGARARRVAGGRRRHLKERAFSLGVGCVQRVRHSSLLMKRVFD